MQTKKQTGRQGKRQIDIFFPQTLEKKVPLSKLYK